MAAQRYYPIYLDLAGKPCLVVGGGTVAEGKVEGLCECAAAVTVISPTVTPRLATLAASGAITVLRRPYQTGDVCGYRLVIAATDDRALNARIAREAQAQGIWVNAVDDPEHCDFIACSVVRRGDLTLAISTAGLSPAMARWVREELEALIPEEFGALLELLAEARRELKARGAIPPYSVWRAAISPTVLEALARGDRATARTALWRGLALPAV